MFLQTLVSDMFRHITAAAITHSKWNVAKIVNSDAYTLHAH